MGVHAPAARPMARYRVKSCPHLPAPWLRGADVRTVKSTTAVVPSASGPCLP